MVLLENKILELDDLFNAIKLSNYRGSRSKKHLAVVQTLIEQLELRVKLMEDNPPSNIGRFTIKTYRKQLEMHKIALAQRIKYVQSLNERTNKATRQAKGFSALLDLLADNGAAMLAERRAQRITEDENNKEIAQAKLAASLPITLHAIYDSEASQQESAKQEQETFDILRRAEEERIKETRAVQTPQEVAQQQLDEMHALLSDSDCPEAVEVKEDEMS